MILQTFSDESLVKLKEAFPRRIPTCFLLWLGNDVSDLKQNTPEQYAAKINFGIENGAVIMGPSIAGAPNHYDELLSPGNGELFTVRVWPFIPIVSIRWSRWRNIPD